MKKNNIANQFLNEKIKKVSPTLSKTERKIAEFFLDQSNDIAFISIHDLAAKIDVGQGSIMRFSKKLGYSGFSDLKKSVISTIQDDIAPLEKFKMNLELGINESDESLFTIAKNEVDNINFVINNFDKKNFNKAISLIENAKNVYTVGFAMSSHLSNMTSYLLRRIGIRAVALNKLGLTSNDQQMPVAHGDVLIAFSFPPYTMDTINMAKYFKTSKAKVISFTNNIAAPIIQYSNVNLLVRTQSEFLTNSIGAVIVVLTALANELAVKNKHNTLKTIDKILFSR